LKLETGFVEYFPGDEESNIILTAPHGGREYSNDYSKSNNFLIPKRMAGCEGVKGEKGVNWDGCIYKHDPDCKDSKKCKAVTLTDTNTIEILEHAANEIKREMNGKRPHVIISKLRRSRMDPNRDILGAAQGNNLAIQVYNEFHAAINHAKQKVKRGLLIDFHLQAHHQNETNELGFLLSKYNLNKDKINVYETGFRALATRKHLDKDFVLGSKSLGAFFQDAGYEAMPSPKHKSPGIIPGEWKYFNGGFITRCHGSRFGGEIDAVQIEFPTELTKSAEVVEKLGKTTGKVIAAFYTSWYQ